MRQPVTMGQIEFNIAMTSIQEKMVVLEWFVETQNWLMGIFLVG